MQLGKPHRWEAGYVHHGTLCLMGAFDVRGGKLFGFTDNSRDGDPFIDLLGHVDACCPDARGRIFPMDNLSEHNTDDANQWFDDYPRWARHGERRLSLSRNDEYTVQAKPAPRASGLS